jgi:8-oxo-dGTP pyrophosphatase MutT (NUDIX family)
MVQKADNPGYAWSSQMAFPGGHWEPRDRSRLDTALRELEEEMGIGRSQVEVIGSLGHFQTINNRDIEAFLGIWNRPGPLEVDSSEIARAVEVPVGHLVDVHRERGLAGRTPDFRELVYPFEDVVIWGATARIIHHFLEMALGRLMTPCDGWLFG